MDSIHIDGGISLFGKTRIQGSKNAALPILAAAVLVPGVSIISNCPMIADVFHMIKILRSIGCKVHWEGDSVVVDASAPTETELPEKYVTKMRCSVFLMGALLGRMGEASLNYPGGCVIGERPIDMHLDGFRHMGIQIGEREGTLLAKAEELSGSVVILPFASVGATENLLLAAVTAKGETVIKNAAKEPEIIALCEFLNAAGAKIKGIGSATLVISGCEQLQEVQYRVPADRIVAGTYLTACVAAGGEIELEEAPSGHMQSVYSYLRRMGSRIRQEGLRVVITSVRRPEALGYIRTKIYPGFPTDLQSPLIAALTLARGDSVVEEKIFENRFRIVEPLRRMGASIEVQESRAIISGVGQLHGCEVTAEELRGGAALVIAGLAAEGTTQVKNRCFIERGYEDIVRDLSQLGARVHY